MELPREDVANYLEEISPKICARFLEYLIEDRHEVLPIFHDRLAELYLSMTLTAKKRNDEGESLTFPSLAGLGLRFYL